MAWFLSISKEYNAYLWNAFLCAFAPAIIGELKDLDSLDISFNKLTEIPAFIGELKNLDFLNMDYNKII